MPVPLAHQTWFVSDDVPTDWGFATEWATIALLAGALALTVVIRLVAAFRSGIDLPWLARLAPWMPFAMRLHLAVSLIGLLSLGAYLSPAMELELDAPGILLGAIMVVTAILMAAGWHVRAAALLLIAAGPIGMLEFGFLPVIQRIDLLGVAGFLFFTGGGAWSADSEQLRPEPLSPETIARAIWVLRVAAGVALIIVAFVEKLAQPELALNFLDAYPQFNLAEGVGLPLGDLEFARVAGGIEVLFGLLLISGALPQLIVVAAGIPFNATLFFFGTVELVGHLPIYGAMLILLVYGSSPELRPLTSELWPWRRHSRLDTETAAT